jgi:alpha-L-rhamnosidase
VWDSGIVRSDRTHDISYTGPPLRSRTGYAWSVRITDEAGQVSALSEPAEFETTSLSEADWSEDEAAQWNGSADDSST